jgi:chorismate mutase
MIQRRLPNSAFLVSLCVGVAAAQTSVKARLDEYRTQIDGVDRQIVELLNKRAAIVRRIGSVKKEAGLAVAAPARERQVLDHVAEVGQAGPLPPEALRRIYELILREMRDWEATRNRKVEANYSASQGRNRRMHEGILLSGTCPCGLP